MNVQIEVLKPSAGTYYVGVKISKLESAGMPLPITMAIGKRDQIAFF